MRAARFDTATRSLEVVDVPVPEPGPLEVLVKVHACGICLSDVHLLDGSLPSQLPVVTLGHEAAGVIERVGSQVHGWQPGQRVVLAGGRNCGECWFCARGRVEECQQFQIMGFAFDGAWAEYVVVPYAAMAEVPDSVPLEQAAVLADAVATPYAALTDRAGLSPGESVGLWGIGGLGCTRSRSRGWSGPRRSSHSILCRQLASGRWPWAPTTRLTRQTRAASPKCGR
jgi:D-arabinose 1-dehydrogenase-like Zn-dependent alcohol dehydrogenase